MTHGTFVLAQMMTPGTFVLAGTFVLVCQLYRPIGRLARRR